MASKDISDLNTELSGPSNLCSNAFLASILLEKPFHRKEEGQNGHVDLSARTSPQIKSLSPMVFNPQTSIL